MAANTTFVLVPGAWHPAACFDALASRLKDAGYQVRGIDNVSFGAEPPIESFNPDVEQVHKIIEGEADKGQDVILFMHSYGGMVGTEACRDLDKKARQAVGKKGGVVRLIYCCAFMVPEGVSLNDAVGSSLGSQVPWIRTSDNDLRADVENPVEVFYNDMTADHARETAKLLKQHSNRAFMSKLTYAAYKNIPTTYIFCSKDNALLPPGQEAMMQAAKDGGVNLDRINLEASHSPFLSMPDEVANICKNAAVKIL